MHDAMLYMCAFAQWPPHTLSDCLRAHNVPVPVRSAFWRASEGGRKPNAKVQKSLGLTPGKKTVLVVGGGDGVGGLEAIVEVHTPEEVEFAVGVGATVIAVNNWDRTKNELHLNQAAGLRKFIPDNIVTIATGALAPEGV